MNNIRMWYEKNPVQGSCYCCDSRPEIFKFQAFLEIDGRIVKKWKTCGEHESDMMIEQIIRKIGQVLHGENP